LEDMLGSPEGTVMNAVPLPDFGGGHPDPNLVHAHELVEKMNGDDPADFGAASDGDGDRNMVLGKGFYINPCDSLAVIAANAHLIPAFSDGLSGVARSMPTSRAVDRVAEGLELDCFETPTGWKYFGNLLDAGKIALCGEESFGTGSSHVREKDGLWTILCWLNLIAERQQPVDAIVKDHWSRFGRDYFTRHDYEAIDTDAAASMFSALKSKLNDLAGTDVAGVEIESAQEFSYLDPVDGSESSNQGVQIFLKNGGRLVYRLSGTGTSGATLRVYIDQFEGRSDGLDLETQHALQSMIEASRELAQIEQFTGRTEPDVIT